MTREGIRQIMKKGLRKKPYLREDKYSYIFEHYDFSVEDFMLAYDEPTECYYYLEIISKSARAKRKPIEEILTDTLVSPEMRKKAEKAIYRSYIATDGVHVKTTRQTLAKHFVKTRCKSLTKYDDFVREYNLWLDGLGLGDNFSLTIESRGYENILNQCDYVLWNQWRSFRYYNIVDQDFGELLSTIDFDQFQNTEISSLKLFRDYKELMQQYDIHDEYELHNLLKKIWSNENGQVAFRKMPTIEVGIPDRDEQVLSLLLQYAPISAENLSTKYEEAYGIKAASVLANYLGCLDVYYFDGVYSITSDNLPPIQFERMKDVLTDVFYTISDVKRLFLREFPDADTSSINPYTLKTLGFIHVMSPPFFKICALLRPRNIIMIKPRTYISPQLAAKRRLLTFRSGPLAFLTSAFSSYLFGFYLLFGFSGRFFSKVLTCAFLYARKFHVREQKIINERLDKTLFCRDLTDL